MNRTITLEGRADKARYTLELASDEQIEWARYIDPPQPKTVVTLSVTDALSAFRVKPNTQLIRMGEPNELAPDSEIAAFWFTRNGYTEFRTPVFYYHEPTMQMVVFPPPQSDDTKIAVRIVTDLN